MTQNGSFRRRSYHSNDASACTVEYRFVGVDETSPSCVARDAIKYSSRGGAHDVIRKIA